MRKSVKRISALIMAALILAPLVLLCVYASLEKQPQLLVLGDSITTGYGLANYEPGGDPYLCNSYANIIASALGLEGGSSYINKAVNGDTSSDLCDLLPSLQEEVSSAKLIIISIGGNDLLDVVPTIASVIAGRPVKDLDDVVNVLLSVPADQYDELAENREILIKIAAAFVKYASKTIKIAEYLKTYAPQAKVFFLKQYNPMKNVPGFVEMGEFSEPFIDTLNASIDSLCEMYGFTAVDVPSVINYNAAGLTNMPDYDIHPNAAGHREIAKLLASHLGLTLDLPEDTTLPETTTEPAPETTLAPEVTTEPAPETTPEPETTTEPEPETTPEPEVTTEPVTEPITEPITEPVTEPITEPVTEPITEPVTEPITEPETTPEPVVTTEPETTPEPVATTETVVITGYETTPYPVVTTIPETEPEVTTVPETTTSPEVTTTPETSETVDDGCFASASAIVIVIACACTAVAFKKKEN